MKSAEKIERLVKKMRFSPDASANKRILEYAETALEQRIDKAKSNRFELNIWRIIMKSKITKFAAVILGFILITSVVYGAITFVKYITQEFNASYTYDKDKQDGKKEEVVYVFRPTLRGDGINSEEQAKQAENEVIQLIIAGKAKEITPGEYRCVLSSGKEIVYDTLGIPITILASSNREEKIKEICDEIEALKKTGNFERTFLAETKSEKGLTVYIYKESFTLSNGVTISLNSGYVTKQDEKRK